MNAVTSYSSVQKWMANVNGMYRLNDQEWEQRLKCLADFCAEIGKNPDEVIAEALADRTEKIDFMRRANRLAKEKTSDARAAHDFSNVVRSFFLHNGARVVTRPYSSN